MHNGCDKCNRLTRPLSSIFHALVHVVTLRVVLVTRFTLTLAMNCLYLCQRKLKLGNPILVVTNVERVRDTAVRIAKLPQLATVRTNEEANRERFL